MSDPASWPRDDQGESVWGDAGRGVLLGRLPPEKPRYEPPLIATLRRYVGRGASQSLLDRLAGSAANFSLLNGHWDLDGKVYDYALALLPDDPTPTRDRAPNLGTLECRLSGPERRILLLQLIVEHRFAGRVFPTTATLARYFGCGERDIDNDIDWLRAEGRIACSLSGAARGARLRTLRLIETPSGELA